MHPSYFTRALGAALLSLLALSLHANDMQGVESFTPLGDAKDVRTVNVRFATPMIAFGTQQQPAPFEIDCAEPGDGRWVDERNWRYDFRDLLSSGLACTFRIKAGTKDLAGNPLKVRGFRFSTGGPWVVSISPDRSASMLVSEQVFHLSLNAEPTQDSVRQHAWCEIGQQRVPLELMSFDHVEDSRGRVTAQAKCKAALPPETPVTLHWGAQVAAQAGIKADKEARFTYAKGVPWIKLAVPTSLEERIASEQKFIVVLNGDMPEASLAQELYCTVSGLNERVPVQLTRGAKLPAERGYPLSMITEADAPRTFTAQCKRRFPDGADVQLRLRESVQAFKVRPAFRGEMSCTRESARSPCSPISEIRLKFAAPVTEEQLKALAIKSSSGKIYTPTLDAENAFDVVFPGPFPAQSSLQILVPAGFTDQWNRKLDNLQAFTAAFPTGEYPPMVKFAADFGVVERNAGGLLPLTVRNLEPAPPGTPNADQLSGAKLRRIALTDEAEIDRWLRGGHYLSSDASMLSGVPNVVETLLPKPSGASAWEVIGIPLPGPGLHVLEVESSRLGELRAGTRSSSGKMYVYSRALNTNLAVHFKRGRESSLIWVTTLDTAQGVPGAAVSVRDCHGSAVWQGTTSANGTARIRNLPATIQPPCSDGGRLIAYARKGDDVSFVLPEWAEGIEPWRYGLYHAYSYGNIALHTIFARSLLRAGETVHMKHFARTKVGSGFAIPPAAQLPKTLVIEHLGSNEHKELPLKWSANGAAETTWSIPKEAKLGTYRVWMKSDAGHEVDTGAVQDQSEQGEGEGGSVTPESAQTGSSFRVAEFRLPVLKGEIRPPAGPFISPEELPVDLTLAYISGGPAGGQQVRVRSILVPTWGRLPCGYGDEDEGGCPWSATAVNESGAPLYQDLSDEQRQLATGERVFFDRKDIVLDAQGGAHLVITGIPKTAWPMDMLIEMEFIDPSGEINTVARRVPLWSLEYSVGIRTDSWNPGKDQVPFTVVALGTDGKPAQGVSVTVDGDLVKVQSHRRRLTGGYYGYDHNEAREPYPNLCSGRTDIRGELKCEAAIGEGGVLELRATVVDSGGRRVIAATTVNVAGGGEWWFRQENHDRIDLIPDKRDYNPGDKARFQVAMPFRHATALITVEREGVLDTYVQPLSGKDPVVQVPIKGNYAPNAYVSVLVVRGRVGDVAPTALIDLGKPAYKLGITEIKVGWSAHKLDVTLQPEQEVYQTRDKAKVKVRVRDTTGKAPAKGAEVALVAVDEALLELAPNRSLDLLKAMMQRRPYEVATMTAQAQVVGKRHYGRKALPNGGGGGRQPTRELFDTLLKWQARVTLDANGEAEVEIALNDALTRFRIVAVATAGSGNFGTGQTTIRTARDLQLASGLPTLVREGDRYRAGFLVRNTSSREMLAEVTAHVSVLDKGRRLSTQDLPPLSVTLPAGAAQELGWDAAVPGAGSTVQWEVAAQEAGGRAADSLRLTQTLRPVVPVTVQQAQLTQIEPGKALTLPTQRPATALPGRGGIRVSLRSTLGGSVESVREYMRDYPFACLEQKTSKAVALHDAGLWRQIADKLSTYVTPEGLVAYFPVNNVLYPNAHGSVPLTAYVLAAAHEAGFEVPNEAKEQMVGALIGFVEGRVRDQGLHPRPDLDAQKLAALDAISRHRQISPNWLDSLTFTPERWPTGALVDWIGILNRSQSLPNRSERLKAAMQILRGRMAFSGTKLTLTNEQDDYWWWLMVSNDSNAIRAALALMDAPEWRQDLPRLVKGILERQQHGHWNTTVANVWGSLMLEKYRQQFEATPVAGTTEASLGNALAAHQWGKAAEPDLMLPWPSGPSNVKVEHRGEGRPYATIASLAAIPLADEVYAGYRIKKSLAPVEQKVKGQWSRGDVVRVTLEIDAQIERSWVVVNDPIPAGAIALGRGLARDSSIARKDEQARWEAPNYEEYSYDAYRAYYEYLPERKTVVEYTLRLNNPGEFNLPPTRVEAMYAPEVFGEKPNAKLTVKP